MEPHGNHKENTYRKCTKEKEKAIIKINKIQRKSTREKRESKLLQHSENDNYKSFPINIYIKHTLITLLNQKNG